MTALLDRLDRPIRGQKTPAQIDTATINARAAAYSEALARLHDAQVRLYRALLATDDIEAELAAVDIRDATNAMPELPPWPDTDEELLDRLRGRFAPAPPLDPRVDKTLTTVSRAEAAASTAARDA